jgi:transposase InsO family protein
VDRGFPPKKNMLAQNHKEYWVFKDAMTNFKGFILINEKRIIIPVEARKEVLQDLHLAHQGVVRMKRRARNTVYWPKIDEDIEQVVRRCDACQIRLPSLQKENYMEREEPSRTFQMVAADFFSYGNREYLAYVERASGWMSICCFNKIGVSTKEMIPYVRKFFVEYGIPEKFESDQGPQFSSNEFQTFLRQWGVEWILSSPHYSHSNGLAESSVKS